ncbi:MAG: hypothetical protein AAB599_03980 [Patescibacteria group bacterium]
MLSTKSQAGFVPIFIFLIVVLVGSVVAINLRTSFNQSPQSAPQATDGATSASPTPAGNKTQKQNSSTPTPTPSQVSRSSTNTNSQPTPTTTPTNSTQSGIGLEIDPSSLDVTIEAGKTAKVLILKSTGASGFSFYGKPTSEPRIGFVESTGGIGPDIPTTISMYVNAGTPAGTYSGTQKLRNENSQELSFPVKVTVTTTPSSPYIKLTYPNGGENFRVGDAIKIMWEGYSLTKCTLSIYHGEVSDYLSYESINFAANDNGQFNWKAGAINYDQTGGMFMGNKSSVQAKIDILCGSSGGQVSDKSDNYFTITK